jgi:hypothetical protein
LNLQTIIIEKPPIFDRILAAFPKAGEPGVIFAWGNQIFNPSGVAIPPALMAHEGVHGDRQEKHGLDVWWESYLMDPEFRYNEELPAHAAEFRVLMPRDRNLRAKLAMATARRLIAPLYNYGSKYSLTTAMRDLERAVLNAR